jgi:hypothetical protein
MNRKWLVPVIAVLVAGLTSYGVTRWTLGTRSESPLDRMGDITFLTHELNLADAQAEQLTRLQAGLGAKLADCCRHHCAARARLGQALADETNGPAQARAMVSEMSRAYEESETATLEHIERVRAMLSPKQRERFDALIGECVCGACTMPGGAAMPAAEGPMAD